MSAEAEEIVEVIELPDEPEDPRDIAESARIDAEIEMRRAIANSVPRAEVLDLEAMLGRYAYWSDKDQVIDLANTWRVMTFQGFKNLTAASTRTIVGPRGGETRVPVARDWLEHDSRMQVEGFAFVPGGKRITADVNGRPAVNRWNRPGIESRELPDDWKARAAIFHNHLDYLITDPIERDYVRCWLAHRIQRPGELPGWHVLLVAEGVQGTGRNWIARMLKAMLGPYVIEGLDLRRILDGGFNAELEQAIVGVVDEIREGGQEHWRHAEPLKSFLTEKTRTINQKYRPTYEVANCLGVLMFSNHLDALPLDETDRRLFAATCTRVPESADYFEFVYDALKDLDTLRSIYEHLRLMDLSGFPIAGRAPESATKASVIKKGRSAEEIEMLRLIREWSSDVMRSAKLRELLQKVRYDGETFGAAAPRDAVLSTAALRKLYRVCGVETWKQQVTIDQKLTNVVVLRNYWQRWQHAADRDVAAESVCGEKEQERRDAAARLAESDDAPAA